MSLIFNHMADEEWHVEFTNPLTGSVTYADPIAAADGNVIVPLPDFTNEIAVRILALRPSYHEWRDANFTEQEISDGKGALDATLFGDGVANLIKYAYGLESSSVPIDQRLAAWQAEIGEEAEALFARIHVRLQ